MNTTRVAAALATVIVSAGFSAVASAQTGCPSSPQAAEVCTFAGQSFTIDEGGRLNNFFVSNPCGRGSGQYVHPRCFPPGVRDNGTQSIAQGFGTQTLICFHPDYAGSCFQLKAGWWYWSLGGWNNQISSYRVQYVGANAARVATATRSSSDEKALSSVICRPNGSCVVLKGSRAQAGEPRGGEPSQR